MNKRTFETAVKLLESAGFSTTGTYHRKSFGSWFVEVDTDPLLRVLWDGKDGWLSVERQTDETLPNGQPGWRVLWVEREPHDGTLNEALVLLSRVAALGLDVLRERDT
jgi:hypothetical protein